MSVNFVTEDYREFLTGFEKLVNLGMKSKMRKYHR